jgi:hypothetical protein
MQALRAFSVLHSSAKQSWSFQISFPARRKKKKKRKKVFSVCWLRSAVENWNNKARDHTHQLEYPQPVNPSAGNELST